MAVNQKQKTTGRSGARKVSRQITAVPIPDEINTRSEKNTKETSGAKKRTYTRKKAEQPKNSYLKAEVACIICFAVSLLIVLSLFSNNGAGFLGGFINSLLKGLFGLGAYLMPLIIIAVSIAVFFSKHKVFAPYQFVLCIIMFLTIISFTHVLSAKEVTAEINMLNYINNHYISGSYTNGGLFGAAVGDALVGILSKTGAYIVLLTVSIVLFILITGISIFNIMGNLKNKATEYVKRPRIRETEYVDEKPIIVKSLSDKKMNYATIPEYEKGRKEVFDHVIGERSGEDSEKDIDLINHAFKTPISQLKPKAEKASGSMDFPVNNLSEKDIDAELDGLDFSDDLIVNMPVVYRNSERKPDTFNDKSIEKGVNPDLETTSESVSGEKTDDPEPLIIINEEKAVKKSVAPKSVEAEISDNLSQNAIFDGYEFPPIELLIENTYTPSVSSKAQIMENSRKLVETLKSFGVEARVVEVSIGPAVTRYELAPGPGVKVNKISGLADDLALSLAAIGIRIEAPIPGKSAVGIEIPNSEASPVLLREVLDDDKFKNHASKLSFAVGKDIAGNTVAADIAKMPHLLIAGSTGSGKSVCINTLITSILFKARPDEVKLLMVDPKVVELSVYNGIPHLLIPVVTDPKKAAGALNWAVQEMEARYALLATEGVRDLKNYNATKVERGEKDILPQIVIIIDELADLMMAASKDVEESICRIAQKARAAGIHLIIATQRPSVNVITGLIKANIPSRLAFAVSSGIDSRTILDSNGAERLLGKGDMLFAPSGTNKPVRIQGAFISDKEVERVVEFLKDGKEQEYDQEMIDKITTVREKNENEGDSEYTDQFSQAVELILDKGKASTSMLQRYFRIGYNGAARLMEELEQKGVVGPEDGAKPRKILITSYEWDNMKKNI